MRPGPKRKPEKTEISEEEMFNSPWEMTGNASWEPVELCRPAIDNEHILSRGESRNSAVRTRKKAVISKKIRPIYAQMSKSWIKI